ncbi:MAG: Nif3-like dinuclear metal center hexameric protein [Bacteroidota bacterium]
MTKVKEVMSVLEQFAPMVFQEAYDNSGLQVGNQDDEVYGVLVCIDVTDAVVDEALSRKANLIIAHHPVIFGGIKRITDHTLAGRVLKRCIKHDINLYVAHTNIDSVKGGVSFKLAEKLGLTNIHVLQPKTGLLNKLVTFVPGEYSGNVREAMFRAGAGTIGDYDSCSYNLEGKGTFRAPESANPFVGEKGKLHTEPETRIETIFPAYLKGTVLKALFQAHPYEEVAYDIYPLNNEWAQVGMGAIGELPERMNARDFLNLLKKRVRAGIIRHTALVRHKVQKVAVCGGSGSFLLSGAMAAGADVFVSGDFKYHQFFEAENRIIIADVGHYESEQFTKDIFYDLLIKNFTTFAIHLSEINTNPIKYL